MVDAGHCSKNTSRNLITVFIYVFVFISEVNSRGHITVNKRLEYITVNRRVNNISAMELGLVNSEWPIHPKMERSNF